MTGRPATRAARRARASASLLALALAMAGCLVDAPTPEPSATATVEPLPSARVDAYRLDTTVWYGGLILAFGTATSTLDARGGPIEVGITLANPGSEDLGLSGPIHLAASGRTVEPSRDTLIPIVPAGGEAAARVVFPVDGTFDVPAAAIVVGRPEEHQAIVQLMAGSGAGGLGNVTLEPVTIELEGAAQVRDLLVTLTSAELRRDLPDWGMELVRGSVALTITYDVAFRSDFVGGFPFTAENLALVLPDGRTISARADGHSAPALVIAPRAVVSGLATRFEVPAPGVGTYRLVVTNGKAMKEIELVIGAG